MWYEIEILLIYIVALLMIKCGLVWLPLDINEIIYLYKKETSDFHNTESYIQLRFCKKNKTKMVIKRQTHTTW